MKSSDKPEPEFLVGCRAVTAYINRLLAPAKLSEDAVYRLADKRRKRPLPTGKVCGQLIASPAKIREFFDAKRLPDKSSIGSKMIASAGSASVPVHRSYMAEGGGPAGADRRLPNRILSPEEAGQPSMRGPRPAHSTSFMRSPGVHPDAALAHTIASGRRRAKMRGNWTDTCTALSGIGISSADHRPGLERTRPPRCAAIAQPRARETRQHLGAKIR